MQRSSTRQSCQGHIREGVTPHALHDLCTKIVSECHIPALTAFLDVIGSLGGHGMKIWAEMSSPGPRVVWWRFIFWTASLVAHGSSNYRASLWGYKPFLGKMTAIYNNIRYTRFTWGQCKDQTHTNMYIYIYYIIYIWYNIISYNYIYYNIK